MTECRRILTLAALLTFLVAPCSPGSAFADTWHVSPAGSDANDCTSPATSCRTIQAAIDKAGDGDGIEVAPGTYPEAISIHRREDLTLQGAPGATIVPPAGLQEGPLVFISRSNDIAFRSLTVAGDQNAVGGIQIGNSLNVFIEECTIEDSGIGGIRAFDPSSVRILDSIIQRNRNHGIRVDTGADVELSGSPFSQGTSIVRQNPFAGVIVNGGTFALHGSTIVENNAVGILAEAGSVSTCCDAGERKILNNQTGIFVRGGHLNLRGPALIQGNVLGGIEAVGGSATFGRFSAGRVIIRENGAFGVLSVGSHLDLSGIDVVANTGRGVVLRDSSSAQVLDTSIVANGDVGIHVEGFSSVRLMSGVTLENNRGSDLSCTVKSHAWGDRTGVRRMSCPGFEQSRDQDNSPARLTVNP